MEQLNYQIKLNMKDTGVIPTSLRLKQGDSGFKLSISIYDGDTQVTLGNEEPHLAFKRADNTSVYVTGEIESNKVVYETVGNELQIAGRLLMDVKFAVGETGRHSTCSCSLEVVNDTLTSDPQGAGVYVPDLATIIEEFKEDAQEVIDAIENASQTIADINSAAEAGEEVVTEIEETAEDAVAEINRVKATIPADYSSLSETIAESKDWLKLKKISGYTVVQGGLNGSSGTELSSTTRLRTDFVNVNPNSSYEISCSSCVVRAIYFYSSSSASGFIKYILPSSSDYVFENLSNANYIRVLFGYEDNSTITYSDTLNIVITPFSKSNVELTNDVNTLSDEIAEIVPPYTSKTYTVNQICSYNGKIWKCLASTTSAPTEGTNWTATTLSALITTLLNA